ncbi:MAG: 2,3-bisphosphoglycerate-independent phosphoglycerate mutase [Acidobacteriia bacterium]|nr:2,3-bisphosphoglycerate-independent phosphoglycerate mutase [Terriglobia bacterium]
MLTEEMISALIQKTDSKILLLVMDGLGGLAVNGKSEMETAVTPNFDALVKTSAVGLADPVSPGITPGSGPGHLAIFGYDPLKYQIGRGVLEALGAGLEMTHRDVAARGNFCTIDSGDVITDRRAGRMATAINKKLCAKLKREIPAIDDVQLIIQPGIEHRFSVLFRGDDLDDRLTDADPQKEGKKRIPAETLDPAAKKTAVIVNKFLERVKEVLREDHPANAAILRGFAKYPAIPSMHTRFGLRAAAIATYPMYRGLAKLVGMEVLKTGDTFADEIQTLRQHFSSYDFFYLHYKKTDSYGEDGNFEMKVKSIEEVDRHIPELLSLDAEVFAITGDHSSPSALKAHSWHPSPFLLHSKYCGVDVVGRFTERECARGVLGKFQAVEEMTLMLANALKLKKYGA